PQHDLYEVLQVSKTASAEEVKKAYRKLCVLHHPDKVDAKDRDVATKKMAEINVANEILMDKERREKYDETGLISV
ncbi:heat shock protein DnaJ, partial [Lepidopterella palustris CBS 459.81]